MACSRRFGVIFRCPREPGFDNSAFATGASGRCGMDLLLVLVFFCGLGLLALRYGHDSRDALRSAEDDLARRGVAWAGAPHRLARRLTPPASAGEALSSRRRTRAPTTNHRAWRIAVLMRRARRRRQVSPARRIPRLRAVAVFGRKAQRRRRAGSRHLSIRDQLAPAGLRARFGLDRCEMRPIVRITQRRKL
jgi:hypothetical protein